MTKTRYEPAGRSVDWGDHVARTVGRFTANDIARFWSKVTKTDSCWIWNGYIGSHGYGQFGGSKHGIKYTVRAHRAAYLLTYGSLSPNLVLDHRCRVTACVRPSHLREVTVAENTSIGVGVSATNARKTHCINGHEFTNENTYLSPVGWRQCRKCASASEERYRRGRTDCPLCGCSYSRTYISEHVQKLHGTSLRAAREQLATSGGAA